MKLSDKMWFVGLFEGEGCVGWIDKKRRGTTAGFVNIAMSDQDVIHKLHRITEVGNVYSQKLPSGKTMYAWRVNKQADVKKMLEILRPHVGKSRRAKIDETLKGMQAFVDNRLGNRGRRR